MENVKIELIGELVTPEVDAFAKESAKCIELYAKKNHDYGNSFDKGMDTIGMAYGVGRIYDKVNRLITLSSNNAEIKDESIDDTITDLACYAIMMLSYRKRNIENKHKNINFE